MKTSLYKISLRSFFIDPLFYVSSVLTILFCAFRFFFVSKFFVSGIGSTDLRPFFSSIPYISIITVPLLALRLRTFLLDDSLPFSSFSRHISILLSAATVFLIPIFLIFAVPLSVYFFGDIDAGQIFLSFLGIVFFAFSAFSLAFFSFNLCKSSPAASILITSFLLAVVNFIHLLPLYSPAGNFLSFLCRTFSFSWHFDSFSKGIFDSRNAVYFFFSTLILILLSVSLEYKRISRKINRITVFLFSLILILLSFSFSKIYFRLDFSSSKQFSVSKVSKELIKNLSDTLRITYFRSKELKNLYPQVGDVSEYLTEFSSLSSNVTLTIQNADSEKLKALGIQGQQIRSSTENKTEYTTVFSTILLQYGEKSSIIPFVLSTQNLEYDFAQRLQTLATGKERLVYLFCGNGRNLDEDYMYVEPWLNSRGFRTVKIDEKNSSEILKNLTPQDFIAVFGSEKMNFEPEELLESALEKGTKAFVMTSQFNTSIEEEWKITKSKNDSFLPYLNSKGFALQNSLVEDISCYPLTMASGEGSNTEYVVVNYPLWLSLQGQSEAKQGVTLFWASPLELYGKAEPVLFTTNYAWLQESTDDNFGSESLFLTDPFKIPKSAKASGKTTARYVVGAKNENIVFIPDQFFLSSLMTGFISGENSIDFRNYDFFASQILKLQGENQLASLMEKSQRNTSLYKITEKDRFSSMKNLVLILNFVLLPILILCFGIFVGCTRFYRGKFYEK